MGMRMAGFKRSVPHWFGGRFCSALFGLAMLSGIAILCGPVAGHGQPAPPSAATPSTAPTASIAATEMPLPMAPVPPGLAGATAELPRDLTPLGMFMSADIVVKAVMVGLVVASVLTWTIWLAKTLELLAARRRLQHAQDMLAQAQSFGEVARPASSASSHVAALVLAAEREMRRSPDLRDLNGIKERIAASFGRVEAGVGRQMMRATGIIATIGATAPFIGLFGTVWGIMNSFIGISKLHTTNLAVVAPGIAEALLTTAFGLAAAIPAVVIYNGFARSIAGYRGLFADASIELLNLLGRDLTQPVHVADEKRVLAAVSGGGGPR
jgi:biopolymer transport protein ExbB